MRRLALGGAAALVAVGCGGDRPPSPRPGAATTTTTAAATTPSTTTAPSTTAAPMAGPPPAPVVAAAGDIACEPGQAVSAESCRMQATADLVAAAGPAVVLTLGDNQYDDGRLEKFRRSYDASWGRFKDITRPSAGNHDVAGPGGGSGYFTYFGAAAGERGKGWYSFDLGGWHLVALNSNCAAVGGCGPGSPQLRWLQADLAASAARCTLAYWHHPRFSSGPHGGSDAVDSFWRTLYDAGAEVVLNGHDHHYERFAPLTAGGVPSPTGEPGMRQFVVGTGGRSLYRLRRPQPGSQVRQASSFGVLLLTLGPADYQWRFAAEPGSDFTDAGQAACH